MEPTTIPLAQQQSTEEQKKQPSREQRFVSAIIERCQKDKGAAARLRRADSPATEYQSWDLLVGYGIDLEKEWQRIPFVTVAATIAKQKAEQNGEITLGRALANCYEDKQKSEQGKARLRRLLACDELVELVRHLRPLLALIHSKNKQPINYHRLLTQLCAFASSYKRQKTKAQWAQEFYGAVDNNTEKNGEQRQP